MYDDFTPSGGNQWWRDPFIARRVARWSLPALAALAGLSSLLGSLGGLIVAAIILALPVMAFFEARGSLFMLQYATSAYAPRRFPPKWWPWLAAMVGAIALLFAGGALTAIIGVNGKLGDILTAMALTAAGGLFLGGLFTLLGYYLDKELVAWVDRVGAEEMRALEERQRRDPSSDARGRKRSGR